MRLLCIKECLFDVGQIVSSDSIPEREVDNTWLPKYYYYFENRKYWGPKECFIPLQKIRKDKLEKINNI